MIMCLLIIWLKTEITFIYIYIFFLIQGLKVVYGLEMKNSLFG